MTEQEIRERLAVLESQSRDRTAQMDEISKDVKELVADMHMRRGQSASSQLAHTESREDGWQRNAWIRSFIPSGLLVGFWLAFVEVLRRMWIGFGG
jgi:hypothetical protein